MSALNLYDSPNEQSKGFTHCLHKDSLFIFSIGPICCSHAPGGLSVNDVTFFALIFLYPFLIVMICHKIWPFLST